jgi:hypothetical protein
MSLTLQLSMKHKKVKMQMKRKMQNVFYAEKPFWILLAVIDGIVVRMYEECAGVDALTDEFSIRDSRSP